MKKKHKKTFKKILNMDLLEDLNVNFVMIYINHKILTLLKNDINYHRYNISQCFLKKYNRLLLF